MYDICMLVYASFNSEKYVEQDNNSPFSILISPLSDNTLQLVEDMVRQIAPFTHYLRLMSRSRSGGGYDI